MANHQAFAALALYNVFLLTKDEKYRAASDSFRDITLSWQNEEGWFQEYEGADPGYHSCSIAFLGKLYRKSGDEKLIEPLKKAVEFAAHFMHPDGSYAGEYGSRNTYHFYPHGFEVMREFSETAGRVADTYLFKSLPRRSRYFNDDNRMCAHYVYDWMQAWLDYHPDRTGSFDGARPPFKRWFKNAKLYVVNTGRYYAVCSLAKGGVLKVFNEDGPIYSDTGPILKTQNGHVLVSHLVDDYPHQVDEEGGVASTDGQMCRRKVQLSSPVKQMAFRAMNLTLGRRDPHLVRSTLQKILITGKPRTDNRFNRRIRFFEDRIEIDDSIDFSGGKDRAARIAVGSDATSIYVANSNTFQESTLAPWHDLSEHTAELNRARRVELPTRVVNVEPVLRG